MDNMMGQSIETQKVKFEILKMPSYIIGITFGGTDRSGDYLEEWCRKHCGGNWGMINGFNDRKLNAMFFSNKFCDEKTPTGNTFPPAHASRAYAKFFFFEDEADYLQFLLKWKSEDD